VSPWRSRAVSVRVGRSRIEARLDAAKPPRLLAHDGSVQAAAAALRETACELPRGCAWSVCIDDAWLRMLLLPWREDLLSEVEWQAAARQSFAAQHRPLDDSWSIHLPRARYGAPRMALAMPAAIHAALVESAAITRAKSVVVYPDAARALARYRATAGAGSAVVAMRGSDALTLFRGDRLGLHAVQSLRLRAREAVDLDHEVARHAVLFGAASNEEPRAAFRAEDAAGSQVGETVLTSTEQVDPTRIDDVAFGLPIATEATRSRRAAAAVAFLLPVAAVAVWLAVLRTEAQQLADVAPPVVAERERGAELPAAAPMDARALASAGRLAQWVSTRWEPPLGALERAWPSTMEMARVQIDPVSGVLVVEGFSPDLASVSALSGAIASSGAASSRIVRTALEAGRSKRPVRFELSIRWPLP